MKLDIPDNYYKNLSCYDEFVLKTNLLGKNVWDKDVLRQLRKAGKYYWFVADGHLCFIDVNGNEQHDVVIDGELDCSYCNELTSLDGVSTIHGNLNCNQCASLETAVIPDSVLHIDNWAFSDCRSLEHVIIPDSVKSMGVNIFYNCSALKSITIPDSILYIGYGAFAYCESLASIIIPDLVKSIGTNAFYNCSSLESIIIPDSVVYIGDNTFYDCSFLKSIFVSKDSPVYEQLKRDYGSIVKCR